MWFSVALMKFHWSGINGHVFNQSECRNCCLYIIIQKIAPQAKSGKYFQIWFSPDLGGKNGGVLSMRMQVILDSSFARPGSAPIWGGKKGEFRDWTNDLCDTGAVLYQLSYQASWELVTWWVRNIPVEGEEYKWIDVSESSYIWTAGNDMKIWLIIAIMQTT